MSADNWRAVICHRFTVSSRLQSGRNRSSSTLRRLSSGRSDPVRRRSWAV